MKTIKTLQDWLDEAEETKFFIVLDEKTLNTMKGKKNKTAKFSTKEEANWAAAGTNDYEIATLVPDDAAEGKDWYSISLYMNGSTAADFEINDISILYRPRPIK